MITLVALIAFGATLSLLAGIKITGGVAIATMIAPSMDAGATFTRRTGEAMAKARMWRVACVGTLINFAVGAVVMIALSVIAGFNLAAAIGQLGFGLILALQVLVCALYLFVGRFFIGLGTRQELKRK